MTEEGTTIVIYEENFPAVRNETVETTVASAILEGFGETTKATQLNEYVEFVEEDEKDQKDESRTKAKYKHKCLFYGFHEACSKSFLKLENTITHMVEEHGVEKDHLLVQEFSSLDDFQIWKDNLELDNYVYYTRRNKQDKRFVYYCCRDGQPRQDMTEDKETKTMLRKTKLTKKCGLACPSKIVARMLDTGTVEMIFYRIHSHTVQLADTHQHPIPQLLKQELYAQFALNSSVEAVHDMLHGKETTVYPIYKAAVRELNKRRLRKIAKNWEVDNAKYSRVWDEIRPSAQAGRAKGPVALEENKRLKLSSVQLKLEQLYHLLDEPVTQSIMLNYMDSSLTKLLTECSVAFAVSDFKFPLEGEFTTVSEKEVDNHSQETVEIMDSSDLASRERSQDKLVAQEGNLMNQGLKRKIKEDDDLKVKRTWMNLGDQENNRPKVDPVTGSPIKKVKIKQNRKKLFRVPQRPRLPGLPIRSLDTFIRQQDEVDEFEKCTKTTADEDDCSSSGLVREESHGVEGSRAATSGDVPQETDGNSSDVDSDGSIITVHDVTDDDLSDVDTDGSSTGATATEVLQKLQLDANQVQVSCKEGGKETSVNSQLLEIVNLAKAMVDNDCTKDQVTILNEKTGMMSNVIEVTDDKLVNKK